MNWKTIYGYAWRVNEDGNVIIREDGAAPYRWSGRYGCYVNASCEVKPDTLRRGLRTGSYIAR